MAHFGHGLKTWTDVATGSQHDSNSRDGWLREMKARPDQVWQHGMTTYKGYTQDRLEK